jgi:LuxR family maltose regulon positive regulatory protein
MKARVWIAQGRFADAAEWARERRLSVTDDVNYLREFEHLTLVRLLVAQHGAHPDRSEIHQVGPLLDRLLGAAETSGRTASQVEIRMLQALAHDVQGDRPLAREALGRAFEQALEPRAYVRLFLDEGMPMEGLLRAAVQHGVAGDHARWVLGFDTSSEAHAPDSARRPSRSGEVLSERELQVLRLLDSELSGPQIARELFVSHNTLRSHTKHIFTKLGVTNRRAAVRRARERGLM